MIHQWIWSCGAKWVECLWGFLDYTIIYVYLYNIYIHVVYVCYNIIVSYYSWFYSPKSLAESSIDIDRGGWIPKLSGLRPKLGVEPSAEGGALPSGPQKVPRPGGCSKLRWGIFPLFEAGKVDRELLFSYRIMRIFMKIFMRILELAMFDSLKQFHASMVNFARIPGFFETAQVGVGSPMACWDPWAHSSAVEWNHRLRHLEATMYMVYIYGKYIIYII